MKLNKFLRYVTAVFMVGVNIWNYFVPNYTTSAFIPVHKRVYFQESALSIIF